MTVRLLTGSLAGAYQGLDARVTCKPAGLYPQLAQQIVTIKRKPAATAPEPAIFGRHAPALARGDRRPGAPRRWSVRARIVARAQPAAMPSSAVEGRIAQRRESWRSKGSQSRRSDYFAARDR